MVHRGDSQHLDLQIGRRRSQRILQGACVYPPPVGHAHFLCCSCSPLVSSLADQITLAPPIPCSITLLVFFMTVSLRSYKLASFLAPQYCILCKRHYMMSIDLLGSSSLAPAPHRPFTHQSFIVSRIRLLFGLVPWPFPSPGPAYAPLHSSTRELRLMNAYCRPACGETRRVSHCNSGHRIRQ